MRRSIAAVASLLLFLISGAAVAAADDVKGDGSPGAKPSILTRVHIDRAGGVHLTKTFAVVFGGIKEGSRVALGPAVSRDFRDGSFAQLKGVYSVRRFALLQARYDSRPIFGGRGVLSARARWQDAPRLPLYELGQGSPRARVEYGERRVEWSAALTVLATPHVSVTGGTGVEHYRLDSGRIPRGEDRTLDAVPDAPGLGTRPWFLHSTASVSYDTRLSPDFSRTGSFVLARAHLFHDMHDGRASFRGYELGAGRLVPTARTAGRGPTDWKGALDLSGRAWFSQTGSRRSVPFYLMPTLGGGDYLVGYPSYRFRDRHAVALRAEYRWAVHPFVDVAALYEAGGVSPTIRGFGSIPLARSVGGGVRLHSKTSGLMRVDLARGRDGVELAIGFSTGS